MTTNADVFKESINKLTAGGGGDLPELSLSGLQVLRTTSSWLTFKSIRLLVLDRAAKFSEAETYNIKTY